GTRDTGPGARPDGSSPDAGASGPPGGGDWLQYRYSPTGTSENPGVFTVAEAANITTAWTISDKRVGQYIDTQALITADTVFFTTAILGNLIAINARDGSVRWGARHINLTMVGPCGPFNLGFWAAAALAGGVLYVPAADGRVYAINPADGSDLWSVQV